MTITEGLPRSYFYQRFVQAVHEVLSREIFPEEREPEMVMRVNIQDSLNRLRHCPACGEEVKGYPDYPLERSCSVGCGTFEITDIYSNGDVMLEFKMFAQDQVEEPPAPRVTSEMIKPSQIGLRGGSGEFRAHDGD